MKTIKQQVIESSEPLKSMTTHTELREWAIANGFDNRSAFPRFKAALNEIGLDYDQIKRGIFQKAAEEKATAHEAVVAASPKGDQAIYAIADRINGNVWIKGDKRRIYVSGGNNYHYNGKWWIEFDTDGSFEVKVWLDSGYGNSKSEEYRAKHTTMIREEVEGAMTHLNLTNTDLATLQPVAS